MQTDGQADNPCGWVVTPTEWKQSWMHNGVFGLRQCVCCKCNAQRQQHMLTSKCFTHHARWWWRSWSGEGV